jgi:hypothetical protein
VLEHTGTSAVLFEHTDWRHPSGAVALSQIAGVSYVDIFSQNVAWTPSGAYLALLTVQGHIVVVDGTLSSPGAMLCRQLHGES